MTHIPLKKTFTSSLYWNLLDSVGTQALLIIHHLLVRHYMSITFHGIYGTLLSLFYLAIILINFGLDYALVPFYKIFTHDRTHARRFLSRYLLPQWLLVTCAGLLIYFLAPLIFLLLSKLVPSCPTALFTANTTSSSGTNSLFTSQLIPLIAFSFITESIKKTTKYILQLGFYVPLTATVEFFGMLLYMALIWQYWLLGHSMNIDSFWSVFMTVSCLQCTILLIAFFYHLARIPEEQDVNFDNLVVNDKTRNRSQEENNPLILSSSKNVCGPETNQTKNLFSRVTTNRAAVYLNQVTGQLFSNNFLVPLCAYYLDLHQASYVKIITSLAQWITLVAQKVFGISSNALLAQTKLLSETTHRSIFTYISSYFYTALVSISIFLLINGKKLVMLQSATSITAQTTNWSGLYFMILVSCIEAFLVLYQNWYTFEEKAYYIALANILCFALFILSINTIFSTTTLPLFGFFLLIIALRFGTLLGLSLFSFKLWRIKPDFKISATQIILTIVFSLLFYWVM